MSNTHKKKSQKHKTRKNQYNRNRIKKTRKRKKIRGGTTKFARNIRRRFQKLTNILMNVMEKTPAGKAFFSFLVFLVKCLKTNIKDDFKKIFPTVLDENGNFKYIDILKTKVIKTVNKDNNEFEILVKQQNSSPGFRDLKSNDYSLSGLKRKIASNMESKSNEYKAKTVIEHLVEIMLPRVRTNSDRSDFYNLISAILISLEANIIMLNLEDENRENNELGFYGRTLKLKEMMIERGEEMEKWFDDDFINLVINNITTSNILSEFDIKINAKVLIKIKDFLMYYYRCKSLYDKHIK